ncbi:MAG: SDR family oxidoreductase [candidate division NC10 bacterium]|nr:SDR family oxidoreductase [candidate division NC10 bacterium]
MELGLKGKVVLVTGASRGIGRAIALVFAAEGCRLALASRTPSALAAVAEEVEALGSEARHWATDVTDPTQVETLVRNVCRAWGGIDVLVNNAGGGYAKAFEAVGDEEWERIVNLNLFSAIRLSRAVLPSMKERGDGQIINIAALSGRVPRLGQIASNAAKAALINFTESLAAEVASHGIRVNAVCPAAILTERWQQRVAHYGKEHGLSIEQAMTALAGKGIPLGRFGLPEEVASAVVFLASERAGFITGVSIFVDGGMGRSVSIP